MWAGKIVVIAGGSKGFGLQLAKSFHSAGSQVVILARNQGLISTVVESLNQARPQSAIGYSVDVTDENALLTDVQQIVDRFSRIDVWINAVGQSTRMDFDGCRVRDYRSLMEQNFFASITGSLAALPHLQNSNGHLINIGSLAAKTAWPFLAPYVTSKHALAGFAKQLRIEGPQNVHYLFVCPGPIRSELPQQRYSNEAESLPPSAAQPGAGAPVRAIDPEWLAEKIIEYCVRRKPEIVVPWKSRLLFSISQLWPRIGDRLIRRYCK